MNKPPRIESRVLDESSPEAQALLDQVDWQTGRLKRHQPFFEKPPPPAPPQSKPPESK